MTRVGGLFLLAALVAAPASGQDAGLACTFTTLCSVQTGCQSRDGIRLLVDAIDGAFALRTADGVIGGTPLPGPEPPALTLLFEVTRTDTILFTLSQSGEAAMTQHLTQPDGTVRALSYHGNCGPAL